MSGHRRVKDIAYDDDDDDGDYSGEEYGEEQEGQEELTPEDQENMRQGTITVRHELGDSHDIADQAIREALFYYYYDIAKTVTYLKKDQKTPQQPKKQKQESKFDKAASSAAQKTAGVKKNGRSLLFINRSASEHHHVGHILEDAKEALGQPSLMPSGSPSKQKSQTAKAGCCADHMSAADYFRNVPWFNVPSNMSGRIVAEPLHPPLQLRGGSAPSTGKPSKLAALAAARKKKEAEQNESAGAPPFSSTQTFGAGSALDRLGSRSAQPLDAPSGGLAHSTPAQQPLPRTHPVRKRKSPSPLPDDPRQRPSSPPQNDEPGIAQPVQPRREVRARPSVFAQTMCGGRHPMFTAASASSSGFENSMLSMLYGQDFHKSRTDPFSGPSPDDVVTQAQAKGSAPKKQATPQNDNKTANAVATGVSNMSLEEVAPSLKVKSKNLNVLAEHERSGGKSAASFVVIGHVDHGKSTLMGRLLYDLKVVDSRSVDKYRKEAGNMGKSSFALAWVMDSTSEERERGVTVDIATNNFETDKAKFTILDAPGHRDFIPNMIAGASQADFAVLVIDASTNSFEAGLRGQTKEHALLVRSMGVQRVIVAVNKMDTVSWNEGRFVEIQQQLSAFLTSAGFQSKNLAFVPCAGLTGENIVDKAPDAAAWYYDPSKYSAETLVHALEAYEPTKAALTLPLRLSISDVFRGGVTNPLSISGKMDAGSLQVGDSIITMPSSKTTTIRGIEMDNQAADWAVAGQIVTLHLTDIDAVHLRVGDVVCDARKPITNVNTFTTKILAFEHVLPMQVDIHKGRLHVPGRITQLLAVLDKSSGQVTKKRPRVIQPGSLARVRVELEDDTGVPLEVPGRVVLRASGSTVAAGLLEVVSQESRQKEEQRGM